MSKLRNSSGSRRGTDNPLLNICQRDLCKSGMSSPWCAEFCVLAASRYCGHMSQGRWQRNLFYSLVDEAEHHGAGGKQSPNSSDKLSPKMVGGKQ